MDRGAWWAAVHGVARSQTRLSDFTFTFHFHALEKEMATHSSVLAWKIPGMGEPGGLSSLGSHRVRHDWSNLAAAAYCLVHRRNSKDWKWLSLEWSNNSHFLQVMWGWIYFWVKSYILHSTIGCKDCSSPMQMERNVARSCVWKASTLWPPDYECSTFTCWQPIKNVIWEYISISLVRFFS